MIRFKWGLLVVVVFAVLASSCQKVQEDKIPPVIVLLGNNPDAVLVGVKYCDPGAVTIDDKHGHDYRVDGEVDADSAGTYFINYTAVDADSNYAYEQRTVFAQWAEDYFQGDFSATDTMIFVPRVITNYIVPVKMISTNTFRMNNFNNYGDSFEVLFQPDSTGNFQLISNSTDTIIQGQGKARCSGAGFRVLYTVEVSGTVRSHEVTYE